MRYLPKSPADREAMLKSIGARSIDDLFKSIPAEYRLNRDLKVPLQMAESEIVDWFRERSREKGDGQATFLGAGAYSPLSPSHHRFADFARRISDRLHAVSTGDSRARARCNPFSNFRSTAICCSHWHGEVANASMYDGSTAAAEAVMMAVRLTGRRSVVMARNVHPEASRSARHVTFYTDRECRSRLYHSPRTAGWT